jgi:UTP:GlnB (protein PII) uridylyltransferase
MVLTMPSEAPDRDAVNAFRRSLPPSYGNRFTRAQVGAHARIAQMREGSLVSVGGFSGARRSALGVCVVAKDQPGLLAKLSGCSAEAGYEISDAEAYTRTAPNGESEAVDLFWVRRRDGNPATQGCGRRR